MRSITRIAWMLFGCSLWLCGSAQAGNDDELVVGNEAAMAGGAVTASATESGALFYNPAGLAHAGSTRIDVAASAYTLRYARLPRYLGAVGAATESADVTEWLSVPTVMALARPLGDGLVLGLGWGMMRSSDQLLREHLVAPTAAGEPSDWSLQARVSSNEQLVGAGLGWHATRGVRVGIGGFAVLNSSLAAASLFGSVQSDPAAVLQVSSLERVWQLGLELGAGVQLDIAPNWVVGFAARSPRLMVFASTEGSTVSSVTVDGLTAFALDEPAESGVTGKWVRAGRYYSGVSHTFGSNRINADVDFQPGVRSRAVGVVRGPVWNARAAWLRQLSSEVRASAALFTDRASDRIRDQLVAARTDFYGGSLGLRWETQYPLAEGSGTLDVEAVFVLRYAFGAGEARALQVDPQTLAFQSVAGRAHSHEVSLYIGSGMRF